MEEEVKEVERGGGGGGGNIWKSRQLLQPTLLLLGEVGDQLYCPLETPPSPHNTPSHSLHLHPLRLYLTPPHPQVVRRGCPQVAPCCCRQHSAD